MIRTTISLPEEIYERMRIEAFEHRKTFGQIIAEKWNTKLHGRPAQKIARAHSLFDVVAKNGLRIDLVKALREERNRDNE